MDNTFPFIPGPGMAPTLKLGALHSAIAAKAPICGISIGVPADKTTWRIDFLDTATDQQKADAQAVITAWTDADWDKMWTWDEIRAQRDTLISDCDWTQLPDAPLTVEKKAAWVTYRQALRDIPETFASTGPASVVWPVMP